MAQFLVTGIREIDRALKLLPANIAKRQIRKALRAGAKLARGGVKSIAPVDSGELKKNVKVKAAKRSRKSIGIDVQIGAAEFTGDQFYAAMVEYGTKKQRPQKYMRRAFEGVKNEAKKIIEDTLRQGIEDEIKKLKAN